MPTLTQPYSTENEKPILGSTAFAPALGFDLFRYLLDTLDALERLQHGKTATAAPTTTPNKAAGVKEYGRDEAAGCDVLCRHPWFVSRSSPSHRQATDWDVIGLVLEQSNMSMSSATGYNLSGVGNDLDIGNGDLPPEWGVDAVIHGAALSYGPWSDRQRYVRPQLTFRR